MSVVATRTEKATGPGKHMRYPPEYVWTTPVMLHRIYNFDVDKEDLKPEHKYFLTKNVVPDLLSHSKYTLLVGLTSRTGSQPHNFKLGWKRAREVERYLVHEIGVVDSFIDRTSYGESHGLGAEEEDENARAVLIAILDRSAEVPPDPVHPSPIPPKVPKPRKFSIRMLSGVALMGGGIPFTPFRVNICRAEFEVRDSGDPAMAAKYILMGFSHGIGLGVKKGPWSRYYSVSDSATEVDDFSASYLKWKKLPTGSELIISPRGKPDVSISGFRLAPSGFGDFLRGYIRMTGREYFLKE